MRNILFVIPVNTTALMRKNSREQQLNTVPYGVLSIASYVRQKALREVNISVLDFNIFDYDDMEISSKLKAVMREIRPDIFGISAMFNSSINYLDSFSQIAHQENPKCLVVVGGIVATNLYEFILKQYRHVNAACYGEGELPFLGLVNAGDPVTFLDNDTAWITRTSLSTGQKPEATPINNLDEIPLINYEFVPIKMYGERMKSKALGKPSQPGENITLPIHTTRGCPFNCIFCCAGKNHGKKVRYMSAQRVLSDVKEMIQKYNMTKLSIDDDQFLINRGRAAEVLKGLSELDISVELASGISVAFIDDEIAGLLKKAGVETVNLAIESGSRYILEEIIEKPLRIEQIEPAVRILRKHNLFVHGFFIIGFPGERERDRNDTLRLIKEVGFDWSYIFVATPFPGSRLYDQCVQKNYIDTSRSIFEATTYNCVIRAPDLEPEYINRKAYLMNLEVNFVDNYRMKAGDFGVAAGYFKGITEKYPDQAFAYYYLAKAYENMESDRSVVNSCRERFRLIVGENEIWKGYADCFGLQTG